MHKHFSYFCNNPDNIREMYKVEFGSIKRGKRPNKLWDRTRVFTKMAKNIIGKKTWHNWTVLSEILEH